MKKVNFEESLSIVIPLHNKQENIANTLINITNFIKAENIEIIIVENGSTDFSYQIALNTIKELKGLAKFKLITSEKGLGNALIKGFNECQNKWVYFIPADFPFGNSEVSYIKDNNLQNKYDLFIGSKSHNNSIIKREISRVIYSRIFNGLLKILFKIPFNDTQGTVFFKRSILDKIIPLESKDFLITTELILKCQSYKFKIIEIPIIDMQVISKSTVKPYKDGIKMLIGILKFKFNTKK